MDRIGVPTLYAPEFPNHAELDTHFVSYEFTVKNMLRNVYLQKRFYASSSYNAHL